VVDPGPHRGSVGLLDLVEGGPSRTIAEATIAEEIAMKELALAEARVSAVKAGPPREQIDIARAQLSEAEAWLRGLEVQQKWYSLEAPFGGGCR
jgi:hypothetical protein